MQSGSKVQSHGCSRARATCKLGTVASTLLSSTAADEVLRGTVWPPDLQSGPPVNPPTCMSARRCCRKPLNGATPVPGPIMIIGVARSAGGLKNAACRRYSGTHASGSSDGSVPAQAQQQATNHFNTAAAMLIRQGGPHHHYHQRSGLPTELEACFQGSTQQ